MASIENEQAVRTAKAVEIAKTKRIVKRGDTWVVPSQSGSRSYVVSGQQPNMRCTCRDYDERSMPCKHMVAVELVRLGNNASPQQTVPFMKPTYPQNWPQYNASQKNEKRHFEILTSDLVRDVPQPPQIMGRPRLPLRDVIFSCAMKVYSTMSGRRAQTDIEECAQKKLIDRVPSYNSLFRYMEDPRLTPVLKSLIRASAGPLSEVEENFAIDSTGITTKTYARWIDHKFGKERSEHVWLKVHAMCGVKTNVVTSVEVTPGNTADPTQLAALVEETAAAGFRMKEVSADKAYLSHANVEKIVAHGAKPYIPFKTGTGEGVGSSELWQRLYWEFRWARDRWAASYHRRSNIESTFHMIKAKFGPYVRSKTTVAQTNEVLIKVLAHNVVVLVGAMYELSIEPMFKLSLTTAPEAPFATT